MNCPSCGAPMRLKSDMDVAGSVLLDGIDALFRS